MSMSPNYEDAYNAWHKQLDVDRTPNSPWHQMVQAYLASINLRSRSVLEVGCGRGGFACWLRRHYPLLKHMVATDLSDIALVKARAFAEEQGLSNISWERGDIQELKYPDSSFDVVISCETIEHTVNPQKALSELARVLVPGGLLILTCPNYFNLMGLYRIYLRLVGRRFTEEGQPINQFLILPVTLRRIVKTGLQLKMVDGIGHYLLVPNRPPIDIKLMRHPRVLMRWFALHTMIVAQKKEV